MRNKLAFKIIRILLGLGFVFFGATKFFPMSSSTGLPQPAIDFMMAMANTGYFIPLLGLSEIAVGILLLFNLWVPLAMVILAPIMLNIILFNVFLSPNLMGLVIVGPLLLFQGYLVYYSWDILKVRNTINEKTISFMYKNEIVVSFFVFEQLSALLYI